MNIQILLIDWGKTIPIRHQVLWPNQAPEFCHVSGDENAIHFGAYIDKQLVCVASVYLQGEYARLRKFATLKSHQKKGIGSNVLTFILKALEERNITYFWCDARESAVDFYQRFGLEVEGSIFYKSDIPYYKMSKKIVVGQV
ncbi:MAG TPA: GNAT family N-acetyltransferase [Leucothrix mucor]|nr:GNAT family N-acetyltransferase [Leucothrix mucor]